jgi:RNA polymerase sigma-70 factor (ECF subfamily)
MNRLQESHLENQADYDFSASNEMLLERCKNQDQEALRVLLRRHERPVYNLLYRMLSNHEDAEEALAEVFVKVWRAAAAFKGDSKFTTWLFRIAANTARDVLRSRAARSEVSIEDVVVNEFEIAERASYKSGNPETHILISDENDRIMRAMRKLSDEDRLLITLYHIQELDYEEVAEITNIPLRNLKVKLFRARQRLKKLCVELEKDGGEDELRTDTTGSSGLREGAAEWA